MKEKVVVGMSGGVDSSVAAYLLKEQGYEVIGVTMRTWRETEEDRSLELSAIEDAKRIARQLEIPHYVLDFSDRFYRDVVCPFMSEYKIGHTPNPCVLCNESLKWTALLDAARSFGAERIATGHYARIIRLPSGRLSVSKAKSAAKDQTYALYRLSQEMLSRTLMPLGEYEKPEIRKLAESIDLSISEKKDSQEICFIPDKDYGAFLSRQCEGKLPPKGQFVDKNGTVLGVHEGIHHYTIGQRKGLNIAFGHPVYVTEIRPEDNSVVLGENEALFRSEAVARDVHFMGVSKLEAPLEVTAKVRYGHAGVPAVASMTADGKLLVSFKEPVRAITPGQSLVAYLDDAIAFGGIIE